MTASAWSRPATAVELLPTADPPGFTDESTEIGREGGILTLRGKEGQDLPLEVESRAGQLADQGVFFRSDSRRDARGTSAGPSRAEIRGEVAGLCGSTRRAAKAGARMPCGAHPHPRIRRGSNALPEDRHRSAARRRPYPLDVRPERRRRLEPPAPPEGRDEVCPAIRHRDRACDHAGAASADLDAARSRLPDTACPPPAPPAQRKNSRRKRTRPLSSR